MNDELFKAVSTNDIKEMYTYEYLNYLINIKLWKCESEKIDLEQLMNYLIRIYGNKIKKGKTIEFLKNQYNIKNNSKLNVQNMTSEDKITMKFVKDLKDKLNQLSQKRNDIYNILCNKMINNEAKLSDIASAYIINKTKDNQQIKDYLIYKFYKLIKYKLKNYGINEEQKFLSNISNFYDDLSITYLISEPFFINLLSLLNIDTIKKLKEFNNNIVELLIIYDNLFQKKCKILKMDDYQFIDSLAMKYKNIMNDKMQLILKKRNEFRDSKEFTLKEIGEELKITRERVRQIEQKSLKQLQDIVQGNELIFELLYKKISKRSQIISVKEIENYTGNESKDFLLTLIFKNNILSNYKFDKKYNCIYIGNNDINKLINKIYLNMSEYYSSDNINMLNEIERKIIEIHFHKYQNIYLKNGNNIRSFYSCIVKKYYPYGFKKNDVNEYLKLKKIIENEVGKLNKFPSIRSISTMLDRDKSLILCDRGTIIDVKNVIELPEYLTKDIINFIYESKPVVYYNTIYEKFRSILINYGVNNAYLLKGLIDSKLPENFFTKRDYISIDNKEICPYENIINTLKEYKNVFSIEELRKKFIGVEDYVFYNILYSERDNGLIFLTHKRFIYKNKIEILEREKTKLHDLIENTFKKMDSRTISTRKIYARLNLFDDIYNLNLEYILNEYDLFEIIKVLYDKEYYYSKTLALISKDSNVANTPEQILRSYVIKCDYFDHEMVNNFLGKMNLGILNSYLVFMDYMSDIYVQISKDRMVKKDKFNITEEELNKIERILKLIMNAFPCIDTRNFKGYNMLPEINYEWNKYILTGIVRSYFPNLYEIENTSTRYNETDYIIRSEKNE